MNGACMSLAKLAAGAVGLLALVGWRSASVVEVGGVPRFAIDGRPIAATAVMPSPAGMPGEAAVQLKAFSEAGVKLSSDVWTMHDKRYNPRQWWIGEGEYDFELFDALAKGLVDAAPDGFIFPRIKIDPPPKWCASHPEEMMDAISPRPESKAWRALYRRMLKDVVAHVEASSYADNVIGYHLGAFHCGEWLTGEWKAENRAYIPLALCDASDPFPPLAKTAARRAAISQRSDAVADMLIDAASCVKELTGGRRLVGAFFGYPSIAHEKVMRVVRSGKVDFFAAPPHYFAVREPGRSGRSQTYYQASYRLHGRVYYEESDFRTFLSTPAFSPPNQTRRRPLDESLGIVRRSIGKCLAGGWENWWFLLGGNDTFSAPELMDSIKIGADEERRTMETARWTPAEVAVFTAADEYATSAGSHAPDFRLQCKESLHRALLPACGVPFDSYELSDIDDPRLPEYKVYLFPNAFAFDEATRAKIDGRIRRAGNTAIWIKSASECFKTAAELREAFRKAGAHVWMETDDVFAAGRGYVMVHAASDGCKTVRLRKPCDASEIFGASPPLSGATSISVQMKRGETRVWRTCASAADAVAPIEVRVRQTQCGPRIFVDGRAVRPRFYFGSPATLCNIAWSWESQFNMPFKAVEDAETGQVELTLYHGEKPIDFYDADLIDLTAGTTNFIGGRVRTDRYVCDGLKIRKGHVYRFRVKNRADHDRAYFRYRATFVRSDGERVELPMPYGDTLGDAVALAADADVNLVTFSTDNSWGCDDWWNEAGDETGFARIDAMCERLIAINPKALLIPRVIGNAPDWFLEKHPESRMRFDRDYTVAMVSVSHRPYRKAVCAMVEKLARHLQRRFPRNFAGLHVGGQSSAEWFYFNALSGDLSGYDVSTRDAFREYLARQGDADAASAEVPSPEERRRIRPGYVFDPVADRRILDFVRFRQLEIASLLRDLGEAVHRGTDGKGLSLFFYGYTWELASNGAGSGEPGHNGMEWLLREGKHAVDGFSGPFSYQDRNLTGSASVMSAAETCLRRGFLWINEDDTRTCLEEFWDNHSRQFTPHSDLWTTEQILLRDSISCILRGYGDWWMDLFGRGWHRDTRMWNVRKALNKVDDRLLARARPYEPEIAVAVDDASLVLNAAGSSKFMTYLRRRNGYARCGGTYGQYFFEDLMSSPPPSVKLVYLISCDLTGARRAKLEAFKKANPGVVVVEATPEDVAAEAVAAHARKAGVHLYAEPNRAYIEAAEGYVMVQAMQSGPLVVDFGTTGEIRDVLTGRIVGVGPKTTFEMKKGEVRLFLLDKRLTLAERGRMPDYTIVLPTAPSMSQAFAAEELRKYVREMTGVSLPIATNVSPERGIFLGNGSPELGNDGFRLVAAPPHFRIEGSGVHGTLFGVYDFLERYCGCEWLAPNLSVVPPRDKVEVSAALDDVQKPAFPLRDLNWTDHLRNPGFSAKLKVNGFRIEYPEELGGRDHAKDTTTGGAIFDSLCPPSKYFKSHPEWFALIDGKRTELRAQRCLTNKGFLDFLTNQMMERIRKNYPRCKYYSIYQNDLKRNCQCDDCKALDEREGSPSATMVHMANYVAERVSREYPDVTIITFAYMYTLRPPKTMRVHPNVMICYCTDACDFSKPIRESRWKGCKTFVENFKKWKEIASKIYIWDYSANFKYLFQPFECCHSMPDNFRYFREMGVFGVFEEGDHYGVKCVDEALKTWVIGHLLWNPDQPLDPLLDRFFNGYYGAAAGVARGYYNALVEQERTRDETKEPMVMWGTKLDDRYQPLEFFNEWSAKWTAAMELVKDDPIRRENVYWARHNVDLVRLVRSKLGAKYSLATCVDANMKAERASLKPVAERVLADFARVKGLNKFRDNSMVRGRVETIATMDLTELDKRRERVVIPVADMRIDDKTATKMVDDPLAAGGKAVRMGATAPGEMHHCLAFREESFSKDAGAKIGIRVHARVEKSEDAKGSAFSVGTCDLVTYAKRDIKNYHVGMESIAGDGYKWYDIEGTWKPAGSETLWIGNGKRVNGENPCIRAVYFDQIELYVK